MKTLQLAVAVSLLTGAAARSDDVFETKIRPLLADKCWSCHGQKKQSSGLRLDSGAAILKGGDGGPVIVPGKSSESRLIQAVNHQGDLKMPPKERLSPEQVEALTAWVQAGAPWPAAVGSSNTTEAQPHWAFQPVRMPKIPYAGHPIDALVKDKLDAVGLTPNPPADRATLIRRLSFDLLGLPPTPAEVEAYLNDTSSDADAKLIDRLLASPRYGERWARHWLDLARYADTKGYLAGNEERRYPFAYTYRDYVIRAFNDDKRYDRFIIEQIAADKLPDAEKRDLAAMGFLTVGRRFLNNQPDIIDDRLDVIGRGLQGLTISCARCHDHKFDPIPTKDYYSLYGVFANCNEPKDLPLIAEPTQTAASLKFEKELAQLEADVDAFVQRKQADLIAFAKVGLVTPKVQPAILSTFVAAAAAVPPANRDKVYKQLNRADKNEYKRLTAKIEALKANSPAAPPRAMVVSDLPKPVTQVVFLRGNPGSRGPEVPRQFLAVLKPDRKPFKDGSGRLDLAQAIADPNNPLTARVLVNRVWSFHFGQGLVTTPSDFGLRSEPPSHPELLDWMAGRFVADGWSLKKLHRLILTSRTYQQSSIYRPEAAAKDAENRLLWRQNRQRLDFESLRDGLLAVSGLLDSTVGGPAVDLAAQPFSGRRSIYGFIDRQNLPGMFRTFDFASPDTHAPQRLATTVPQQALYMMNGAFVNHVVTAVLKRPDVVGATTPEAKIAALYARIYQRAPKPDEVKLGVRFLEESSSTTWEQYVQALLLSNEWAFVD